MYLKGNISERVNAIIILAHGSGGGGGGGGGQCELFLLGHYLEVENYYILVIYLICVLWHVFSIGIQHIEMHLRCVAQPCCACLLSP